MPQAGRAQVFARGALKKGLVSRAQAEECLAVARKLRARGKALPIEQVFLRKGYLNRAEAASIAKRLRKKGAKPELALLPEESRPGCPNCKRDPGSGSDCFRCGADLATGGPGPRATTCGSCAKVVLRGAALCPECARPIRELAPRARRRGGRAFDRLIMIGTLAGMGYFVHHHGAQALADAGSGGAAGDAELVAAHPAFGVAGEALKAGRRDDALEALEDALAQEPPAATRLRLLKGIAELGPPERAAQAARAALAEGEDPAMRLVLGRIALDKGQPSAAADALGQIPAAQRGDEAWRLIAAVARQDAGDWLTPILHVKELKPDESRAVALALVARGRKHLKNTRTPEALRDLRRARAIDDQLAEAEFALGLALLEVGEDEKAHRALKAAVRLDPARAAPYLALALSCERLGKTDAAVASYGVFVRQAEQEGGHAERVAQAKERLAGLKGR